MITIAPSVLRAQKLKGSGEVVWEGGFELHFFFCSRMNKTQLLRMKHLTVKKSGVILLEF